MADGTTPVAPSGAPADFATTIGIVGALAHLVERLHNGGAPAPAPRHEPKQQRRQSGPARDTKGRFKRRR